MSELITSPGSTTPAGSNLFPDYGLQVISEQPVTLRNSIQNLPQTDPGTVTAIGSSVGDFIVAINPNDPTIFNLAGGDGADTLKGAAGNDVISGDLGDDAIGGGSGDDIIDGGVGNDSLQGEDGNDLLSGGDGNDTLQGGNGKDLLLGGVGNDVLEGGADNDVLISGVGDDSLDGGAGDDRLQGGRGKDTLTGGRGKDKFRFEKGTAGFKERDQADVITDFNPKDDLIQFDRRLFKGELKSGKLGVPRRAGEFMAVDKLPDDLGAAKIIYERSTGLIYFNSAKDSPTILVQVDPGLNITASDFEIFY